MTDRQEEIDHFIRLIRGMSPQYLRYAGTHGACHRFFLVLKDRFPSARLFFTCIDGGGHCLAKIAGKYWDIWGEHDENCHGSVRRPKKGEAERMASCIFDEGYVLRNTHQIFEWDTKKARRLQRAWVEG